MSGTREKFRAVFFASVMLLSMVAMSTAFAGSAAAVTAVTADDASATINTTNDVSEYRLNTTVDDGTGTVDLITVSDQAGGNFDLSGVTNHEVLNDTGDNVSTGINIVDADTVEISLNDEDFATGDQVNITLSGVVNPETSGDYTVQADFSDAGTSQDTASADVSIESSLNADLSIPKAAPYGSEVTATATFENVGESAIDATNIELDGSAWSAGTLDSLGAQTIAAGETVTLDTTFNTSDLNDATSGAVETNDITASIDDSNTGDSASVSQGLTVGTSDSGAVEIEATDTNNNPVDNVDVTLYQGSEAPGNVIATGNTGSDNFLRFDGSSDGIDGGLAVGASGSAEEYVVKAEKEGFEAATRSALLDTNNVEGTVTPSLQRIITPDDISVTFSPSQSVSIENQITATVSVTTDDRPGGNGLPMEDTPVDVTFNDNTGSVAGANSINVAPSTNENTDQNGEVEFTFSVNGNFDDIEDIVEASALTFEATENTNEDVSTAENRIEFVPDIGDTGTITGTVTNIGEDQQLGVESNLESAEGIQVYAVDQSDVDSNTESISDGDGLNSTVPSDLSDNYNVDFTVARFNEGDIFRVVTFDDGSAIPRDPRSDYLVTTSAANSDLELVQNESVPGVQIHQTDTDPATDNIDFTFLESGEFTVQQRVSYTNTSDADDVEYRFKNVTTTSAGGATPSDLVEIADSESITFDDISAQYASERAVPNDTTTSTGDFALLNLPTDQDATREYTVIAGQGQDADGQNRVGFANFAGYETNVPVEPNADNNAAQQNVDLSVQNYEPVQDIQYELDITVQDGNGEFVKDTNIAQGGERTVEVLVQSSEVGTNEEPTPVGAGVELDDLSLIPNNDDPEDVGSLDFDNLETNDNGVVTATFQAASAGDGTVNVTASASDDTENGASTTGSQQATVTVFGAATITGDIVNEDGNNLPGATVRLYENANDVDVDGAAVSTVEAGTEGSYTFIENQTSGERLQSGQDWVVEAEFDGNTETRAFNGISTGTNDGDIVIVGGDPAASANYQIGGDLGSQTATAGEEASIDVTVTNQGQAEGNQQTLEWVVAGNVVDSATVGPLGVGDSTTVTLTTTVPESLSGDTVDWYVQTDDDSTQDDGTKLVVLTENGEEPTIVTYADADTGVVGPQGLGDAAADFRNGDLSPSELGDVAAAFRNGEPVR